jgi:hypothetical protein
MNLSLHTGLSNNIDTLGGVAGFSHSLGLSDALLLLCALLLGHNGALVLGHLPDGVGALGNGAGVALLLGNSLDGVGALLDTSGGALLLRYRLECGGAVLHRSGGALLLVLGNKVCDGLGGAHRLVHNAAHLSGHSLVHSVTLGGNSHSAVVAVVMSTISVLAAIPVLSMPARLSFSLCLGVYNSCEQQY